ncbi:lasso peptide biosynthesis PqqD family chaperone [aff. Roholtiella sp. LEGE 12411]|uniref:lasso peptide biosynthesis PqqD family chaperone n=1 Tax=aff. Roholtiella sp. LEGE 12411 TaxID=1828822 RepID=UPI001882A820|nr:lasso peptide biosynthesis PqqD family chaperone [aff. Roholtiella sp. LEGE 12411]MBE9038100.1 lasso peptide biosynthesis PqqD family chaperone [aff. Roholtiella sp. LEGE 12411]
MVTGHSRVVVAKEQISSDLAGEAVILNLKSGTYYGLNAVGASIWNLIQQSRTISEIQDALLAEYEVEPEQCDRELLVILQQLEEQGLIEVNHEAVG